MEDRRRLAPFVIALTLLAAAAVQLAEPPRAGAGAWTREPGGRFLKLGLDRWSTPDRLDATGARVGYAKGIHGQPGGGRFSANALRGYAEFGWREGWTAIAAGSVEALEADYGIATLTSAGIGDLHLGLRRRLVAGPVVVAAQGDLKVPTFYDAAESPALGTGKLDAGGRLLAGASSATLYASAEAGFLARGARADEVPYALEAGWSPSPAVLLRGELRGASSVGAARTGAAPAGVPGMFDPALASARWLAAGGAVVIRGMPVDVVFEASRVLEGRNTLAGTRLGVSIWHTR